MPHADSAFVPQGLTKPEFWSYVHSQLEGLLSGQRHWITNLANASSLIYSSLLAFEPYFGRDERAVNWCGFYIHSTLFPTPQISTTSHASASSHLLLGPFCGKPACQFIDVSPEKARGVCAEAYIERKTKLVPDVESYPGHIACDGDTKSEIVCPLVVRTSGRDDVVVGVLDLDCLALGGFDADDQAGLQNIADLVVKACDW